MDRKPQLPHYPPHITPPPGAITNADLSERLDALETKIDLLYDRLNQSVGAWTAFKIIGSFILGLAIIANAFHSLFHPGP